jgi:hypothetical protein
MKKIKIIASTIILLLFAASICYPRAGGSGGGSKSSSTKSSSSSSSKSSSSKSSSSSSSSHSTPTTAPSRNTTTVVPVVIPPTGPGSHGGTGPGSSIPTASTPTPASSGEVAVGLIIIFLIFGLVVFIIYRVFKKIKVSLSSVSDYHAPDLAEKMQRFTAANPDFNMKDFTEKVHTAFIDIQTAWGKGSIGRSRRYISDGVYQRFATQLEMMKKLKQHDQISDIKVDKIFIADIDNDGEYDILHTAVTAGMKDAFISETDPTLNSPGGFERFTEYWSFMRKRSGIKKDMYHTFNCPSCSAPLPDTLSDSGKCPFCSTMLNNAEFDWVLSEITQPEDFSESELEEWKDDDVESGIQHLVSENEDFSVQLVEDKASNGYLQIAAARAFNEPERVRRFVTDDAFEKITASISKQRFVYNRIYLCDVVLVNVEENEKRDILSIGVKCGYQRAVINGGRAELLDPEILFKLELLVLEREKGAKLSKGSVYAHNCPACGAPITDSLDVKCGYCSVKLNSPSHEWIITDINEAE